MSTSSERKKKFQVAAAAFAENQVHLDCLREQRYKIDRAIEEVRDKRDSASEVLASSVFPHSTQHAVIVNGVVVLTTYKEGPGQNKTRVLEPLQEN